jgi:hypothetical protein
VSNSSTLDGFDNFAVSAFNPNLNVDAGSTVAAGTTLAAIAFSGNWPGTISGRIVPICVSNTNYDWSAFVEFKEAGGCVLEDNQEWGTKAGSIKVIMPSGGAAYINLYDGSQS